MKMPSRKTIKVLHVIDSAGYGGGERYLLDLIRHASPDIFHQVIMPHGDGLENMLGGAAIVSGKNLNMDSRFSMVSIYKLASFICQSGSVLVHSHGYRSNLYGRMTALLTGRIHLCTVHVSLFDYVDTPQWLRRSYLVMERLMAPASSRFIAISGSMAVDAVRMGIKKEKIVRIPNGVDLGRFHPWDDLREVRAELGIPKEGPVIGTVGRMVTEKGQEYLIRALPMVKERFSDVICLFIGEGPLRDRLMSVAAELNVLDICRFAGVRGDIERIYPAMDLFVLPSLREPFGLSLLEAMACGIPVIATAAGGPLDFIESGRNGMLVPPGNPEALSQVMTHLLSHREIRDSVAREGNRTAREKFDVRKTVSRHESVYRSLAGSRSRMADRRFLPT